MFIYDLDKSCSTDDQIRAYLMPMTTILPMLLKKINTVIDALAIERITTTSKQSNSGDCGVYTIKYIEFLSIDRKAELVSSACRSGGENQMLNYTPLIVSHKT
ncbi:Uncharacterized protein Adt_06061 [Abeliophyllum distichum]|uniref:Ubiquitin-like protease family profile domain-containing protein n=1 Tax=Abeliophyllum distichum TaxID=126358 RepID=A0ABD1V5U4_9LAMI